MGAPNHEPIGAHHTEAGMQKSEKRILTTHVGSLPRNPKLTDLLLREERDEAIDKRELDREAEAAVAHVVQRQLASGIDIGNDGEQPRVGFQTYVARRMKGFGGESPRPVPHDFADFPDFAALWRARGMATSRVFNAPQAVAEVEYVDLSDAENECAMFLRYTDPLRARFTERFMTAASPGIVATTLMNAYYDSHESYVMAVARQLKKEYELIHSKGLVLQIDCPDLAMERHFLFQKESVSFFQKIVETHIAAINVAVQNIPRDRIRLHVCWGNYDGPHNHDVPLEDILPIICQARVGALSLELANPRHQHEYKVFKKYPLPDSMLFLPGVVDSTTNYIEHPEIIADRIMQAVEVAGDRSRVIAGTDCGFGTFAGWEMVAPSVVWAKLRALREGAELATRRLWG